MIRLVCNLAFGLAIGCNCFVVLLLLMYGQLVAAVLLSACVGFTWWAFDTGEQQGG